MQKFEKKIFFHFFENFFQPPTCYISFENIFQAGCNGNIHKLDCGIIFWGLGSHFGGLGASFLGSY